MMKPGEKVRYIGSSDEKYYTKGEVYTLVAIKCRPNQMTYDVTTNTEDICHWHDSFEEVFEPLVKNVLGARVVKDNIQTFKEGK